MLLILDRVRSARDEVFESLGEPSVEQMLSIFPLSASAVTWGIDKGCSLKRALKKWWGIKGLMPAPVLRGALVDAAITGMLQRKLDGKPFDEDAMADDIYNKYADSKGDFDLSGIRDIGDYLETVRRLTSGLVSRHKLWQVQPLSVQEKIWLYIGHKESVLPVEGDASPPDIQDWVIGYLDWVEQRITGRKVVDLKVTSSPVTSSNSGAGKYKLQAHTYPSAYRQRGIDVPRTGLLQLHPGRMTKHETDEDHTQSDYRRVIQKYRQVRDHYLGVIKGRQDFLIPYNGYGECTDRRCSLYQRCPMGGGRIEV